jgi:hypothetical protein
MTEPKNKNETGVPAEKIKKPGIINQLIPWVITAVILFWLYRFIDFRKMFQIMATADLKLLLPAIIGFSLLFGVIDTFTFGQAYSWFSVKLTTREKFELRVAPYVIQVIFAPLAEVFFPLWLWRQKGVSPTHAVSSTFWTVLNDLAAVATALTIAVIYNLKTKLVPQINVYWLYAMIAFWVVYLANLAFWHSPLQPRMAAWIEKSHKSGPQAAGDEPILLKVATGATQLLRTFSIARWYHYLAVYGIRSISLIGGLVSNYATLRALDITVPLPLAVIAIPIIFYAHFLPINVGGYGGPQAISILFFYEIGHCGSKEQIAAYSFLWSTGFLVGRFLFGLAFIRPFWRHAFPEGFSNWRKGTQ